MVSVAQNRGKSMVEQLTDYERCKRWAEDWEDVDVGEYLIPNYQVYRQTLATHVVIWWFYKTKLENAHRHRAIDLKHEAKLNSHEPDYAPWTHEPTDLEQWRQRLIKSETEYEEERRDEDGYVIDSQDYELHFDSRGKRIGAVGHESRSIEFETSPEEYVSVKAVVVEEIILARMHALSPVTAAQPKHPEHAALRAMAEERERKRCKCNVPANEEHRLWCAGRK